MNLEDSNTPIPPIDKNISENSTDQTPSNIVEFPIEQTLARASWEKLARHLEGNYHEPDLEAIRIMCAAAASHELIPDAAPVWVMLIGASGSGKTSQVMPPLAAFQKFHPVSHVTKSTFLSGFGRGAGQEVGLLRQLGDSIIFGFSDFTSVMSMQQEAMKEVMSQMRQMYDGEVKYHYGTGHTEEWKGKATLLACVTPEIERRLTIWDSLGARFLGLRWRMGDPEELALMAGEQDQQGKVKEFTTEFARGWIGDLSRISVPTASGEEMKKLGLEKAAALIARLRKPVAREGHEVVEAVGGVEAEGPGRIIQAMYSVARAHAALFRRRRINEEDVRAGVRLGRETAPLARWRMIELIDQLQMEKGGKPITAAAIRIRLEEMGEWAHSQTTLERRLQDLGIIGILKSGESAGQRWYEINEWTRERLGAIVGQPAKEETIEDANKDAALANSLPS